MYSFRMSFWTVPRSSRELDPAPPPDGLVQGEQDGRGGVDRHRRGDGGEVDALEEQLHVGDRVDRHADPADLPAAIGSSES